MKKSQSEQINDCPWSRTMVKIDLQPQQSCDDLLDCDINVGFNMLFITLAYEIQYDDLK